MTFMNQEKLLLDGSKWWMTHSDYKKWNHTVNCTTVKSEGTLAGQLQNRRVD